MKEIELTPPQSAYYLNKAKFPLFVGGYGAGKSTTMICGMMRDIQWGNVGAYCPTFDLLSLITAAYLEEFLIEADIPYKFNKSRMILSIEGGNDFVMRSMDNPARIVGYQTYCAHVDELDTLTEKKAADAWNKIVARNRQPVIDLDKYGNRIITPEGKYAKKMNRVLAYTTPEGFRFAYKRWVQNKSEGYSMVRAPTRSNPHLPEDYILGLMATYPEELIEAYLNAQFVNLNGQAVYRSFDRNLNACDTEYVDGETIYVGVDFNVLHGAAIGYVKRGEEFHAVFEVTETYDTDETVQVIEEHFDHFNVNIYPDATGGKRTSNNVHESDIAKLHGAKFSVYHHDANPSVKDRVMAVNLMIYNPRDGKRRLKVNTKKCPKFTEALEQQVYTEAGMPDKSMGVDHCLDAAGYPIAYMFPVYKPVHTQSINYGAF